MILVRQDCVAGCFPFRPHRSCDEDFLGLQGLQKMKLALPEGDAIDLKEGFIETHAARFAAGKKNGAEG